MIRILPEILSNKIAAGEVVERPAAVVKELVENALDAGATRILVEVEQGGKALVRVSDNGCGMCHDDVLLSIERYATSKIKTDQDLFAIRTLGFRGEALPSIAAVCRFVLISRDGASDAATRVKVAGGKIIDVAAIGAPQGTVVEAADLFFNLPARRKFLKSPSTEIAHIADGLAAMALAYPNVAFTLVHNGKILKNLPATADPALRVAEVLGQDLAAGMLGFERQEHSVTVTGWAGPPIAARATFNGLFAYVNGRHVHDRVIQKAVMEAYLGRLMKGRFPVAAVFVLLPADQVDVNVHPAKHQVRFAEASKVFSLVNAAVSVALAGAHRTARSACGPEQPGARMSCAGSAGSAGPPAQPEATAYRLTDKTEEQASAAVQEGLWMAPGMREWTVIGLLDDTYILCRSQAGLVLVDQHAAHERVVYEKLKKAAGSARPVSQRLLIPDVFELGHCQADALIRLIPALNGIGFDVEPFGGTSFALKAVPGILAGRSLAPVIADLADTVAASGIQTGTDRLLDASLQTMACHSAIRAGHCLNIEEMKALLAQLGVCADPAHCPHGRPTWIVVDRCEIERRFGRRGPELTEVRGRRSAAPALAGLLGKET